MSINYTTEIYRQRGIHLDLLKKYDKNWRESNDPLIKEITYEFDDDNNNPEERYPNFLKDWVIVQEQLIDKMIKDNEIEKFINI